MNKAIVRLAFVALPVLILLAACNKEPNSIEPQKVSDLTVSFQIGGDAAFTKASASVAQASQVLEPIDLSEASGIEGLRLTEEISSLDDCLYAAGTKATPVFTENLAQMYDNLLVDAYQGTTDTSWGNKDVEYTNDGGNTWSHNYSKGTADNNLAWPDGNKLVFVIRTPNSPACTYAYSSNSTTVGSVTGTGVGTITVNNYVTPKDGTSAGNDAEYQNDILYSTKKMAQGQTDNDVLLYHALTGVKFKVNSTANDNGVKITGISKVEFKNLISKGSFTIKPAYEGYETASNSDDAYPNSSKVVVWERSTEKNNFSQTFTADEQGVDLASTDSRTFPTAYNEATANLSNLNDANATKTFFFIPQKIDKSVTLTVTYTYTAGTDTTPKTATTDIAFGEAVTKSNANYEWLPGELRTYTLNVGDDVTISIEDEISNKTKKSGLTITNTNTATCYIRVAVIGNWLTDAGTKDIHGNDAPIAITPCDQSVIVGLVNTAKQNGWVKGDDNFFYYLYPLAGGKVIKPENTLFGTIDFTSLCTFGGSGTKPYKDCHLEVTVAAQAVLATEAPNIWPSAIASQLKHETRD